IYHLDINYKKFVEGVRETKRIAALTGVVFPVELTVVPGCVFRKSGPIIVGLRVVKGILKYGVPLIVDTGKEGKDIGVVEGIELEKKSVEEATEGMEVAVRIGGGNVTFGRDLTEMSHIYSKMTRSGINAMKKYCRDPYTPDRPELGMPVCPEGFYCNSTAIISGTNTKYYVAGACSSGQYSDFNASSCLDCPIDMECPTSKKSMMRACKPGYYSDKGDGYCHSCPGGDYCTGVDDSNDSERVNCPAGQYSPIGYGPDTTTCRLCPAGMYCEPGGSGVTLPVPCPINTYASRLGLESENDCLPCPPGKYCPEGYFAPRDEFGLIISLDTTVSSDWECPAGYYCPQTNNTPQACPVNTFNPIRGAHSITQCLWCPPGYYCDSTAMTEPVICPTGNFCPGGNPAEIEAYDDATDVWTSSNWKNIYDRDGPRIDCPRGTYMPYQGAKDESECILCPAGYNCRRGASTGTAFPCASGTYRDKEGGIYTDYEDGCIQCPAGFLCDGDHLVKPTARCKPGHYCPVGSIVATECPIGTWTDRDDLGAESESTECPIGTWTDRDDLGAESECEPCPKGYYCPNVGTSSNPLHGKDNATFVECPQGFYCPLGSKTPLPCPAGTYNEYVKQFREEDCVICEKGYMCGTSSISEKGIPSGGTDTVPCTQGYYCPRGTANIDPTVTTGPKAPRACPKGTFGNTTGLGGDYECDDCEIGYQCPTAAMTAVGDECQDGYYQDETGQTGCKTCPAGYMCPAGAAVTSPTVCSAGYYSDEGASSCTRCPAGHYCPGEGVSQDMMEDVYICPAKFLCIADSIYGLDLSPTDDPTTYLCPIGQYCEAGTTAAEDCPAGTYRSSTGAGSESDCTSCPPGKYCETEGLTTTTGSCQAGYYCTGGATVATQYKCPAGTYSSSTGNSSKYYCKPCPAGYYCGEASTGGTECSEGHYCPASSGTESACPKGTYALSGNEAYKGLRSTTECYQCPATYYCDSEENVVAAITDLPTCSAGYYCLGGSSVPEPVDGVTGSICPKGSYCPAASDDHILCPVGTFNPKIGSSDSDDCLACPAGYYCPDTGMSEPGPECQAGCYCPSPISVSPDIGSSTQCPYSAPAGSYAASGYSTYLECPIGTYTSDVGQASCQSCPAGKKCPNTNTGAAGIDPEDCGDGYYCEAGTGTIGKECPAGTCSSSTTLTDVSECTSCPAGRYCPDSAMSCDDVNTDDIYKCDEGYICLGGKSISDPVLCPTGHYCESGTTAETECPVGTYQPKEGTSLESECLACTPGFYCDTTGASSVSTAKLCDAGFYCPAGSVDSEGRSSLGGSANICPVGHYCEGSNSIPVPCEIGKQQPSTGQTSCSTCTAGTYCNEAGLSSGTTCDAGYYCPSGSIIQLPCPIGRYSLSTDTGSSAMSQCRTCPAGKYCSTASLVVAIVDDLPDCDAGFLCEGSCEDSICSTAADPNGTVCPSGYYCEAGTTAKVSCPKTTYDSDTSSIGLTSEDDCETCKPGYYCDSEAITSLTGLECAAGYYCPEGSGADTDDKRQICPVDHYCVAGSSQPTPCDPGTYAENTGSTACSDCPIGSYCPGPNTSQPISCPAGSYCGSSNLIYPTMCDAGKYQSNVNKTACVLCPSGFYCPYGCSNPTTCPAGHYCPASTDDDIITEPIPCPPGTYNDSIGSSHVSACKACSAGNYCPKEGTLNNESGLEIEEGYYCKYGCSSSLGELVRDEAVYGAVVFGEDYEGGLCPLGSYCPKGSSASPITCPVGTYNSTLGATSENYCLPCPSGYYCSGEGLEDDSGKAKCSAGYYCISSASSSSPVDGVTGNICKAGTYCVEVLPREAVHAFLALQDITVPKRGLEDDSGKAKCSAGYYCISSASSSSPVDGVTGNICKAGTYCVEGSGSETLCPVGTYSPSKGSSSCISCPAGYYCPQEGMSAGIICPAGFYCPAGCSDFNTYPCAIGTHGGGVEGMDSSGQCVSCPAGYYCGEEGISQVSTACDAGYYCLGGATKPNPTDGVTGDICPIGMYCVEGSSEGSSCAVGKIRSETGGKSASDCYDCPAGSYCEDLGGSSVTGKCAAGYYCPSGTKSKNPPSNICPSGYKCPEGSGVAQPCPAGFYQDLTGQSSCKNCPAGEYCPGGDYADQYIACPAGSYCPASSPSSVNIGPITCPDGYYSEQLMLMTKSQCVSCPAGYFCAGGKKVDKCEAGYVCYGGSWTPTPDSSQMIILVKDSQDETSIGEICPTGYYCPEGSLKAERCPTNTYSFSIGATSASYCEDCRAGYLCDGGVVTDCPIGMFCPAGDVEECPVGTYNDATNGENISACKICEAGYYCPDSGMSEMTVCPMGHYCPEGSIEPIACSAGSYTAATGSSDDTMCLDCPAGSYCVEGASSPVSCVLGQYCPSKSTEPIYCEAGTYGDSSNAADPLMYIEHDVSCAACP
ncbi:hypothetical protein ADUPG1_007102, partial [Aduncisulcus paluster]